MQRRGASRIASRAERRPEFEFEETAVPAGSSRGVEVRVARLPGSSWATLSTVIVHGPRPGPTVWLSGAIHGDELNGVEIVRRLLIHLDPRKLAGTVIGVPIVNVFGVTIESRYLPDRRDLNRSFPGSKRGSLAGRLAHLFFDRVAKRCDLGIDYHTGANGRCNLPQVRGDLDNPRVLSVAREFASPVLLHATSRDGSLRAAARKEGIPVLIYEAGEASRFDEVAIQSGVDGTLRVLRSLGMISDAPAPSGAGPAVARTSRWVRAGRSGFCHLCTDLGDMVKRGDTLATVSDAVGKKEINVRASSAGIVIGVLRTAMVHRGDALVHVAEVQT